MRKNSAPEQKILRSSKLFIYYFALIFISVELTGKCNFLFGSAKIFSVLYELNLFTHSFEHSNKRNFNSVLLKFI